MEAGIRTGALPPGAALPPVRTLADRLGVSPATVAKAYRELRQRGVVETGGRHGTRIRTRPPVAVTRQDRRLPMPPGMRDLANGEPDRAVLPDLGPALGDLATRTGPAANYSDAGTDPELLELATAQLTADGIPVTALTVTAGTLDGMERLLTTHLHPGDRVAVEDPGWANAIDLVAALGLVPVGLPLDDDGPTPAGVRSALRSGVRALLVTSRAQNPTGAALSAARAAELRGLLAPCPDLLVIEDDHAAGLVSEPVATLAGATRSWAFLRSVAKAYGPDLRLALLCGDAATVARVAGRLRLGTGWVSTLLQGLVVRLWRDPATVARVAHARHTYDERRAALREALRARGIPARGRTGLHVWVPVPDETLAVARLRDAGYAVAPGSLYRLDSAPGIRITTASLPVGEVEPLAGAIAAALRPPQAPRSV